MATDNVGRFANSRFTIRRIRPRAANHIRPPGSFVRFVRRIRWPIAGQRMFMRAQRACNVLRDVRGRLRATPFEIQCVHVSTSVCTRE